MSTNAKETAENIKAAASMAAAPITNAFAAAAMQSDNKCFSENKMKLESSVISKWSKSFVTHKPGKAVIREVKFKYEFESLNITVVIDNLVLIRQNKIPTEGGDGWNSKLGKHGGYERGIINWSILPEGSLSRDQLMRKFDSICSEYNEAIDSSVIDEVLKMFPVFDEAIDQAIKTKNAIHYRTYY